jgi:hypothetical protein
MNLRDEKCTQTLLGNLKGKNHLDEEMLKVTVKLSLCFN